MRKDLFEKLHKGGLISEVSFGKIKLLLGQKLVSVHLEIKTLLYLGVLLLSGGLGILVYKHIDTIGHQAVLVFIALISAGSFYYCFKYKLPFSVNKVDAPDAFFDYILLLACLTFITFIVYIQYQYKVFGNHYSPEAFLPMLVLFFSAYYFDHLGILSLGITNLVAWLGIAVTPMQILQSNDFSSTSLIVTGLFLGVFLIVVAWVTNKKNIKKHFALTYSNFGTHLLFIACLVALFNFYQWYLLWFLVLLAIVFYIYRKAIKEKSFYFMLITVLYGYIGLSYVISRLLVSTGSFDIGLIYLWCLYYIASAVLLVLFLIRINKKFKVNDSL